MTLQDKLILYISRNLDTKTWSHSSMLKDKLPKYYSYQILMQLTSSINLSHVSFSLHWYSINLVCIDNCHKIRISTMRVYLTHVRLKLHHRLEVKMRVVILYLKIWCLKVYLNLNQTLARADYCFLFCRPFFNLHNILFCWFYCITPSSNKTTTNNHIIK